MDNIFVLNWHEFSVNLDKVNKHLKSILSSNYDGLVCDEDGASVMFIETYSSEDENLANEYWDSLTATSFNPTLAEIVAGKIEDAQLFGNELLNKFATENVLLGITQAGKTIEVTNYLHKLSHYVMTGSLYAALIEIATIIQDQNKSNLAPFITNDRMIEYKHIIQTYLQIPLD